MYLLLLFGCGGFVFCVRVFVLCGMLLVVLIVGGGGYSC